MSKIDTVKKILDTAHGNRVGGRSELLPGKKVGFISEDTKQKLLDQWEAAGRDAARTLLKFTENNGTELFITGADGEGHFVGYETDKGFGYIDSDRLEAAKLDKDWDTETPLGNVRHNLEEMEKHQVHELLTALKKRLSKRGRSRRRNEAQHAMKHILKQLVDPSFALRQTDAPAPPAAQAEDQGNVWRSDSMVSKETRENRKKGPPPLVGKGKSEPTGKDGMYTTKRNQMEPTGFSESAARFRAFSEDFSDYDKSKEGKRGQLKIHRKADALTRKPGTQSNVVPWRAKQRAVTKTFGEFPEAKAKTERSVKKSIDRHTKKVEGKPGQFPGRKSKSFTVAPSKRQKGVHYTEAFNSEIKAFQRGTTPKTVTKFNAKRGA